MERKSETYDRYINILKGELIPALGCTEPIAVALAAAIARKALKESIKKVEIAVSNNILKNVKSVVVPNTNGAKGIQAAAAVGIIAGVPEKMLEVIADVSKEQEVQIMDFIKTTPMIVLPAENTNVFDIVLHLYGERDHVTVRITDYHTNVILVQKNNQVLYEKTFESEEFIEESQFLLVEDILKFTETVEIEDVKDLIMRQIQYNYAIAEEGMKGNYGANIGQTLLLMYGDDIKIRARAMAAAGSDARMSGCELPVVVVSGSGNQGITTSVPVIVYAKELGCSEERLIRAVLLADLLTIHLKYGIGRLSAFCGAISAGCSAGAAIAYLHGGGFKEIAHTLVNSLAIVSGIVCDGAKPSCAGKIASAVDAGILGWQMYQNGNQFRGGDGLVSKGVENTIRNVSRLGKVGMKETDDEIVKIMLSGCNESVL